MSTIVLIHGLWVTPRSWEQWIPHYEAKGHKVIAPAYPGFKAEVEALRADPSPIASLTVPETVAHLEKVITGLPEKPVLIGHSFGGLLTQLLLDRGHGAAGVVIDSAPPQGIRVNPPSQLRSLFPIFNNPAKRHQAAGFTPEQFHYAFTNTLPQDDAQAAYDRYAIAAPGSWVWTYGLIANLTPGKRETWVDFHNPERAPLLFLAGGRDHIMPPAVNKSNFRHYKGPGTITDYHEFPERSHWTCAEPGWEEVADYALDWALRHAPS
ncbi:alpha/beta hydrolase [Streptomyces phaeochromogenes]|uniref:alpha/beta hydrolase n=1 Tax=Streptomyces phaeochromogenes TaxID=1923 RepID=UPI0006E1EE42|nr:alpha/beta hydrolase [Streptomyces phaeochromogenes]